MKGYVQDIEKATVANKNFRKVLYTAKHCQLVVMSLDPKEDIGEEVHTLDQFIKIERGSGHSVLDGKKRAIKRGFAVLIPAGTRHNIVNGPRGAMKIYTVYAPPNHKDGTIHKTKAIAEVSDEQFDGRTTE